MAAGIYTLIYKISLCNTIKRQFKILIVEFIYE